MRERHLWRDGERRHRGDIVEESRADVGIDAEECDRAVPADEVLDAHLVAGLRTVAPAIGAGVLSALQSPQPPPIEVTLSTLLNAGGLASLTDRGVTTGMLFVDAANASAIGLYTKLGFTTHRVDRAYTIDLVLA